MPSLFTATCSLARGLQCNAAMHAMEEPVCLTLSEGQAWRDRSDQHADCLSLLLLCCDVSSRKLSWYNNINASLGFLPLVFLAGEHKELLAKTDVLMSSYYWFVMTIAGFLGFAIGIVTVMQINYTTPLTHNISGTVKACVQTILAILIFKAPWTWKGLTGIGLTIGGSLLYAVVKMAENDASKAATAGYSVVSKDEGVTAKLTQAAEADEDELESGLSSAAKHANGHSGK